MLERMKRLEEVCWLNPSLRTYEEAKKNCRFTIEDIKEADMRLRRFAPFIKAAFPETASADGIIESELAEIPLMKKALEKMYDTCIPGRVFLKKDSHLPVAGSVKARGGVYEILCFAENIALKEGLISLGDDYSLFLSERFRSVFSRYSIAVGSTGNLGLSIGIISAKLGFNVSVHMSSDAKQWKKDILRSRGVNVVEYEGDYSEAVKKGRLEAEKDSMCYFVDDENSEALFLGYSTAALRLEKQLRNMNISVTQENPLIVSIPCGVGGAPAGIFFGLKQVFTDAVHCFFAEPVNAPCMLAGLYTGLHNKISVSDIGIDGKTIADGLAVGRVSGFAGKTVEPFIAGCYTVKDEKMLEMLKALYNNEGICLEPSALAGMSCPALINIAEEFSSFRKYKNPVHIVWATGGGMVPENEMKKFIV